MASIEPPGRPILADEPPFLREPSHPAVVRPAPRLDPVRSTFDSLRIGLLVLAVPVLLAALTLTRLGNDGAATDGAAAAGDRAPSAVDGLVAGIGGGDDADLDSGPRTTAATGRGAIGTGQPALGTGDGAASTTAGHPGEILTLPSAGPGPAPPAAAASSTTLAADAPPPSAPPPGSEAGSEPVPDPEPVPGPAPTAPAPTPAPSTSTTSLPPGQGAEVPPAVEIPWGRCLITVLRRTTVREEPAEDAGSFDRTSGPHLPTAVSGSGDDRWYLISTWVATGWVPVDRVGATFGDCG